MIFLRMVLLACTIFMWSCSQPTEIEDSSLEKGLMLYYPFDGNANDSSVFNHNGEVFDVYLTSDRVGDTNSAYRFTGYFDSSTIKTYFSTIGLSSISAALWVKPDVYYNSNRMILQTKGTLLIYLERFTENKILISFDGSSYNNSFKEEVFFPIDDEWHLITAVNINYKTSIYIDGVLKKTYADTLHPQEGALYVGCNARQWNFFDGKIDDIRIYDRALLQREIDALYSKKSW